MLDSVPEDSNGLSQATLLNLMGFSRVWKAVRVEQKPVRILTKQYPNATR
jgi:hypothetical protein